VDDSEPHQLLHSGSGYGFQVVLDSLHPCSMRACHWSTGERVCCQQATLANTRFNCEPVHFQTMMQWHSRQSCRTEPWFIWLSCLESGAWSAVSKAMIGWVNQRQTVSGCVSRMTMVLLSFCYVG